MRESAELAAAPGDEGTHTRAAGAAGPDDERMRWVATAVSITNLESAPAGL